MTRLHERILRLIEATGPMGIDAYMALCLFDPDDGYYTTREPFGAAGDFTTAPEVSQMFGELVAVWLYAAWKACGTPDSPLFAEIGPGRGTLMKDILRTLSKLDPQLVSTHRFAMIEVSPRLTAIQKKTLEEAQAKPAWFSRVEDLPDGPLFIVGNELFDAVPIKEYVKTPAGWRERVVGHTDDGALAFGIGPGALDPSLLPKDAEQAPEGTIFETAPAREALMDVIAERLSRQFGAGLFIDYGYSDPALGDTLQAVRRHAYDDPLAHPGEADLTAHVDFAALGSVARTHGLETRLMPQGEFLLDLGLLERAGRLGAGKSAEEQQRIRGEVERLAGPQEMGELFKAMAVLPVGIEVPPF
ncbi:MULTISPECIES: class I SAM-dependent methyltransferase [Chelativorans]|jgi:SAM-dependent MidA family methyltransferase|uniref:ATP synthase beta subunit/transription termination factor rho n=1 Tax=Chelativorans sp. (strain BNC1) TaxID=266779 RepID=Q11GD2_CHESB|nr:MULTISPECIES: class I SAM-dependent methyltransferase [Chelativorans]